MGLDTSHNCWHGLYSSFNRFRYTLAAQIGIDLDEYIGYNEKGTKHLDSIKHGIEPLLNHSDCEGKLKITECRTVLNGLNLIIEKMIHEGKEPYYNFRSEVEQFAKGLREAIEKREQVKFR